MQEFMNFTANGTESLVEYSQTCKNKSGSILGFIWMSPNEILFITTVGLELFQVVNEKLANILTEFYHLAYIK